MTNRQIYPEGDICHSCWHPESDHSVYQPLMDAYPNEPHAKPCRYEHCGTCSNYLSPAQYKMNEEAEKIGPGTLVDENQWMQWRDEYLRINENFRVRPFQQNWNGQAQNIRFVGPQNWNIQAQNIRFGPRPAFVRHIWADVRPVDEVRAELRDEIEGEVAAEWNREQMVAR